MPAKKSSKKSAKKTSRLSASDQILANQKKILKKLDKVFKEEQKEDAADIAEEKELLKIEEMESNLEKELEDKPLKNITVKDFFKSAIGAFFGILGHFSFFYGVEIAHDISLVRASLLYVLAFVIGAIFLYSTGYRKVERSAAMKIIPLRLFIIYLTSILIIIIVLSVFGFIGLESSITEIFKTVATISILAVMGAVTADLIGKERE